MRSALWVVVLGLAGCITESNPGHEAEDAAAAGGAGGAGGADAAGGAGGEDAAVACRLALVVEPEAVVFGRVPAFDVREISVNLRNTGTCALALDRVRVDGPRAFGVLLDGVDPRVDPSVLAVEVAPGAVRTLVVRFAPADVSPASGQVVIESAAGALAVPLSGNGGACAIAEPAALDLRAVPGGQAVGMVVVRPCGDAPVTLEAALIAENDGGVFSVAEAALPVELAPNDAQGVRIGVAFQPEAVGIFEGVLAVRTSDPSQPLLSVRLVGRAAANICPVASVGDVDTVRPDGAGMVALDGSASRDPDGVAGLPVAWEWVVLSRPEGSAGSPLETFFNAGLPADGGLPDDPATPTAVFFVDIPGRYLIELRVTDADGCVSSTQIVVEGGAEGAVVVQLTWVGEADLDLHVHHPEGALDSGPFDCSARNPSPDWPPVGPAGDAVLDRDDRAGGPETITLTPEATAAGYGVGVLMDSGPGPATATLRIFLHGRLAWEDTVEIAGPDGRWEAVRLTWPDEGIRPYTP